MAVQQEDGTASRIAMVYLWQKYLLQQEWSHKLNKYTLVDEEIAWLGEDVLTQFYHLTLA
jgi:hypothetical protein